ncbi:MAG TPA: retropepsin-like aspartic protease, partial [Rhodocyclaceae bacterium]|nr:retropepsin-like aspartic protease [Rhodocyclaceae bacterium]
APTSQALGGGGAAFSQVVAGGGGHFAGMGAINGVPLAMMVDTGATDVSLSAATARQVGLDLRGGRMARTRTANGIIPVLLVSADSVTFAGQTVKGVSVDVRLGQQDPAVLLGMSFLQYFEMNIDGGVLSLRRK